MYKAPLSKQQLFTDEILTFDDSNYYYTPQTSFSIYKRDFNILLFSAIPTSLCFILELVPSLTSIYFIGQLGDPRLISAIGLATMWVNCSGSAIFYGIAVGLETLASQAFGAKSYELMSLYYQRAMLIIMVIFIPVSFGLFYSAPILEITGANSDIAGIAQSYMRILLFSVMFGGIFDATKCYLHAQNIFNLQLYVGLVVSALHILWCIIFIRILDLKLLGAGIAKVISDLLQLLLLLILIKYRKAFANTWWPWSRQSFKGWIKFLKVTIPVGSIVYLEWFAFEFYAIQAANLSNQMKDDELLAAHISLTNSCNFYSMISLGLSIAVTTYVGNAIGQNNLEKARRLSRIGTIIGFFVASFFCLLLEIFKEYWASFFSEDETVKEILIDFVPLMMIIMMLDTLQYTFIGILRAISRQKIAIRCYFLCSYVIGQPLSYFFAFKFGLSLKGIWLGYTISLSLLVIVFSLILQFFSNWEKQMYDIQIRLELENKIALKSDYE